MVQLGLKTDLVLSQLDFRNLNQIYGDQIMILLFIYRKDW